MIPMLFAKFLHAASRRSCKVEILYSSRPDEAYSEHIEHRQSDVQDLISHTHCLGANWLRPQKCSRMYAGHMGRSQAPSQYCQTSRYWERTYPFPQGDLSSWLGLIVMGQVHAYLRPVDKIHVDGEDHEW